MNQRIKKIRKALNLTQIEFGKSLGLEQGSYSDIERGKTKTLSNSIQLILKEKYNINIAYLLTGEGPMFKNASESTLQEPKAEYKKSKKTETEKDKEIEGLKKMIEEKDKMIEAKDETLEAKNEALRLKDELLKQTLDRLNELKQMHEAMYNKNNDGGNS